MITSLYAGILTILFFFISIATIKARRRHQISVGFGPNNEIAQIVGAHSNFASYAVIFLLLLHLAEFSQVLPSIFIHIIGLAFTVGRFSHYFAFKNRMQMKYRILGMHLTLWPLLLLAALNIFIFLKLNLEAIK